jgi:hypothetical protein
MSRGTSSAAELGGTALGVERYCQSQFDLGHQLRSVKID